MTHLIIVLLLPITLAFLAILAVTRRFFPTAHIRLSAVFSEAFWEKAAWCALAVYAVDLALSVFLPALFDSTEVNVAVVSYLCLHGNQMYTTLTDTNRYSLLYGPLFYLPYVAALFLFGATLASLKWMVALVNGALFLTLWLLFRQRLSRPATWIALGGLAAAFTMKQLLTFMVRGDTLMALTVAASLLFACSRKSWPNLLLFCAACACGIDVKVTAAFYFLVPFYFLWQRQGRRSATIAVAITGSLCLLPFSLSAVSLRHYLAWLGEASHHPLGQQVLARNLIAALILFFPLVLMGSLFYVSTPQQALTYLRRHKGLAGLFLISASGSLLTGSKLGAGRSHLVPTLIVSTYLMALLWTKVDWSNCPHQIFFRFAAATYSIFLIVPAIVQLHELWSVCVTGHAYAAAVTKDIDGVLLSHPGRTVEMGYNEDVEGKVDPRTFYRTELVFAGNPVTLDLSALFDMGLSGLSIPTSTVDYIRSCKTDLWLIPKDSQPFTTINPYAADAPRRFSDPHLFDGGFREAFSSNYRKTASSQYYDLWECKTYVRTNR